MFDLKLGHAMSEIETAYRCPTLCDTTCTARCHEAHAKPPVHDPRICAWIQLGVRR